MAAEMKRTPAGTAEQLMDAARARERARSVADAVEGYIAAGKSFLEDEADAERAKLAFDAAAALDPSNIEVLFQRARMDAIRGRLRDALAKFQTVVRASGQTHVPAMFETGCMHQELGQFDQAVLAFRRVLDRDSGNLQALVNVARRLQAMGMRPEAINHYMVAAETAFDRNQYGTCRHLLGLIQSMDPLHAKARLLLADLNGLEGGVSGQTDAPHQGSLPDARSAAQPQMGPVTASTGAPDPAAALAAEIDALRAERDRLKGEIERLASAVASEETELAALRMRRETAANVLAMLQAQAAQAQAAPPAQTAPIDHEDRPPQKASRAPRRAKLAETSAEPKKRATRAPKSETVDHEGRPLQSRHRAKKKP